MTWSNCFKKIITLFPILLLLKLSAYSQVGDTLELTLSQAVSKAISDNANLAQSYLNVQKAENETGIARARLIPSLSLSGNYTRNIARPVFFLPENAGFPGGGGVVEVGFDNSFSGTLQGNVPLFDKSLWQGISLAKVSYQVAEANLNAEKNELKAQVKQAFLNALLAKEMVIVQLLSLENAKRNLEDIRNQFEQGIIAEYDYLRSIVNVENIRPNVVGAQNNYSQALNQLKLLTGTPVSKPVKISGSNVNYYQNVGRIDYEGKPVTENPSLKTLEFRENLQEEQVELRRAALYPAFNGFGNYQYQGQENHFDFSNYRWVNTSAVGLNLNFLIFQGLVNRRQIEQAEIDKEIVERQYEYLYNTLSLQAENALNSLRLARASINAQKDNVALAEKAYDIAQVSYRNGVIRLIELNDAEFSLTEARVNFISAVNEFLLALVEYERILGRELFEFSK